MNEEDETTWAGNSSGVGLTRASTHVNCTERYIIGEEHTVSDDASRLRLRLVQELSETACSPRARKRIRRGIVWQVAYGTWLTHPEGLAVRGGAPSAISQVSPQSSNDSEHMIVSSSAITPYTN